MLFTVTGVTGFNSKIVYLVLNLLEVIVELSTLRLVVPEDNASVSVSTATVAFGTTVWLLKMSVISTTIEPLLETQRKSIRNIYM